MYFLLHFSNITISCTLSVHGTIALCQAIPGCKESDSGCFCVKFARSPRACVGFLWVLWFSIGELETLSCL